MGHVTTHSFLHHAVTAVFTTHLLPAASTLSTIWWPNCICCARPDDILPKVVHHGSNHGDAEVQQIEDSIYGEQGTQLRHLADAPWGKCVKGSGEGRSGLDNGGL